MQAQHRWETQTPRDQSDAFDEFVDSLQTQLRAAGRDIALRIKTTAQDLAPQDTGELIESLESRVRMAGAQLQIVVGSDADQAAPMEFGTVPFFPPVSELRGWARRVLGDEDAAFGVALKISQEGIDEQPYLVPALRESVTWARNRLKKAVQAAIVEAF